MSPSSWPAYDLIALDLDGTLLDSRARLSAGNAAAIAACHAAGVEVTLATGKLLVSARLIAEQLGLTEPQITANGAVIMAVGAATPLHLAAMPTEGYQQAMAALLAFGLPAAAYTPFAIYTPEFDPRVELVVAIHEPRPIVVPALATRAEVAGVPIVKVLTVLDETRPDAPEIEAALRARFEPGLTVVRTSPIFFEFLAPGVDKGEALRRLAALRSIDITRTLAIGDSYNDIALLQAAGFGVAMAHAPAALRAAADAVTLGNDEDGVAAAIYRYVLAPGEGALPLAGS